MKHYNSGYNNKYTGQSYELLVPPAEEPLTLAEVKTHLRVEHDIENGLITALIMSAREYAEVFTQRVFIDQQWLLRFDTFPGWDYFSNSNEAIYLERSPASLINSLKYLDTLGSLITMSPADYITDLVNVPPRIVPGYLKFWPITQDRIRAVEINFQAGYANAAAVPQKIKQALLLMVADSYQNREDRVVSGTSLADKLLWSERVILA